MNKACYPRKSLGQNFLTDPNIIRKIIRYIDPCPQDHIVEIGPGQGALTNLLIGECSQLTLIEVDPRMAEMMENRYDMHPGLKVIRGDILKVDWNSFLPADKIVGNLPYNISSQILFTLYKHASKAGKAVFMVQKEFARRLIATPSTKDYGIMTVLTRLYGEAKILFHIPPTVFFPRPKVDSTLVAIQLLPESNRDIEDREFFHYLVRTAFNQRRKTLRNSLKKVIGERDVPEIDTGLRAEALSFQDFKTLYHALKQGREGDSS